MLRAADITFFLSKAARVDGASSSGVWYLGDGPTGRGALQRPRLHAITHGLVSITTVDDTPRHGNTARRRPHGGTVGVVRRALAPYRRRGGLTAGRQRRSSIGACLAPSICSDGEKQEADGGRAGGHGSFRCYFGRLSASTSVQSMPLYRRHQQAWGAITIP